jgi:hypothetical protein
VFYNAWIFNADITKWSIAPKAITSNMFTKTQKFDHRWCNSNWDGKIVPGDFEESLGMMKCCRSGEFNGIPIDQVPYIDCEKCQVGQFTNEKNIAVSCKKCSAGWHQNNNGKQYCLPCNPGEYQDQEGQKQCIHCQIGQFVSKAKATSCDDCSVKLIEGGSYQDQVGKTWCKLCAPGRWSNKTGLADEKNCTACKAGRWSKAYGADNVDKCCKFRI